MKTSLSPTLRFLIGFACIVVIIAGLKSAASIFNQVTLALLIALTAMPLMNWLRRKGVSTALALVITAISILLVLAVFVVFMSVAVSSLAKSIPAYATELESLQGSIEENLSGLGIDVSGALEALFGQAGLGQLLSWVMGSLMGIVGIFASFVVTFMMILFLLVDSLSLPKKMAEFIDAGNTWLVRAGEFSYGIQRYMIITGIIGAGTGVVNTFLLFVLGVDFPILWGVLAFLLNYVPMVGYWLALIPPMLLGTLESGVLTGVVVFLGYWIINGTAENIIKPKMMGEGLNLSPATVFFSVILWTTLLGPFGALLGVPLTMAIKELILETDESTIWVARLLSSEGQPGNKKPDTNTGGIAGSDGQNPQN